MLSPFWPTDEAVRECLKVDAEAADPAVLLAVHQPMRLQRRDVGAQSEPETCGEERVLEALLAPTGDGRVIVPIVGNSGVGKSHVIRWLDAQLQFAPGHEQRVVVRISKGQSLKSVLGRLLSLDQLTGPKFQQIREQLSGARDKMSEENAGHILCESLAQRIKEVGDEAAEEIRRGNGSELRRLQKAFGAANGLPWLLRDPALRAAHWMRRPDGKRGPVARLVEPFTDSVDAHKMDARKVDLDPDDFALDSGFDIQSLGVETRKALGMMALHTPNGRKQAASVLNASLDDAKRTILGLESSVSELFDKVRTELLAVGKELVLLIEDFAVLSGMQKQLLQAVIREGIRDGKQVRCTLRTALAYTEGSATFLFDDTYRSRAKTEWLVPEEEAWSFEDVLGRAESLVAAYLNAARVGVPGLREALGKAKRDSRGGLEGNWVPRFGSDRELDVLEAFSTTDGGNLFPLNRAALARLIRENCQNGKSHAYNPRLILQGAVLKTLECRHEILASPPRFPGTSFVAASVQVEPAIEDLLRDLTMPPSEKQRLRRVLAYWYDDAKTAGSLKARPVAAFEAFSVDHGWLGAVQPASGEGALPVDRPGAQKKAVRGNSVVTNEPPPPPSPERDPLEQWKDDLSAWRSPNSARALSAERSSKIRNLIAKSLDGAIDWQWFNLKLPPGKIEEIFKYVYVPNASGGIPNLKPGDSVAVLCTSDDLADAARSADAQETVLAMLRFHEMHGQGWDYDRAEIDAARYCAFVETQVPQATSFVRSRPFGPEADPVPLLVSGLALAARCNGIPGADRNDHDCVIASMFDELGRAALTAPGRRPGDPWDDLALALSTLSWGMKDASWSVCVLDLVAARQGGDPLAINAGRLKSAIEQVTRDWELATPTSPINDAIKKRAVEGGGPRPGYPYPDPRLVKVGKALESEVERIGGWVDCVKAEFGRVEDKSAVDAVMNAVDEALDECVRAGYSAMRVNEVRAAASSISTESLVVLLAGCETLRSSPDRGARLAIRSKHDKAVELAVSGWLEKVCAFFKSVEDKVAPPPSGGAPDPVAAETAAQVTAVRALEVVFEGGGQR